MARKKSLVFETQNRSSKGSARRFWFLLVVCVLAVLIVSLAVIMKNSDYDIDTALGFEKETETTDSLSETQPVTFEAERVFLLWCADSDRQKVHFMSLVKVELPECRVTVCAVDPDSVLEASESPASIYAKSGEKALVAALEKAYDIDIDRYAGANETDFKTFVNNFGGIKITVPEQINYKSDELSLVLIKGNQNLKGDTLYKYMLYLNSRGAEGKKMQSDAMLDILGGIFNPANTEKRSRIFSRITNDMITDMTIVDFSAEENGIILLMQNGIMKAETADYPEELS